MDICFAGSNQAGIIGCLTLLAKGARILSGVSYSQNLSGILKAFGIPAYTSVNCREFIESLPACHLLFSVHAKEIVGPELLRLPKLCAVNIHPYLYKYKGANPVGRALADREFNASVGAHIMEAKVDCGRVLVEEFADVSGSNSADEIYNRLYPYYCSVIAKVIDKISKENE